MTQIPLGIRSVSMGGQNQGSNSLMTFEGLMNSDAIQRQGQWWQQMLLGNQSKQAQIPQIGMNPIYNTYGVAPDPSAAPVSAYDLANPPSSLDPYAFSSSDSFTF